MAKHIPVLTPAGRKADDERAIRMRIPLILACVVIMALILGAGYAVGQYVPNQARATAAKTAHLIGREQADEKTQKLARQSSFAACKRGNQRNRAINQSNGAIRHAFVANAMVELKLTKVGKDPKRRVLEQNGGDAILTAANEIQYLPTTNCQLAITHPLSYHNAAPITWGQHLRQNRKADR